MFGKALLSALVASILFAVLGLIVQVAIGLFIFTNSTAVVRYVGERENLALYSVVIENESFRDVANARITILSQTSPILMTSSRDVPRFSRGGRSGETQISVSSLRPGERTALLIGFPRTEALPTFTAQFPMRMIDDHKSTALEFSNILWTLAGNVLIYFALMYYWETRRIELKEKVSKNEDEIQDVRKVYKETMKQVEVRLSNAARRAARARLLYDRRIDSLTRENLFWRRIATDLFSTKTQNRSVADDMLRRLLSRVGISKIAAAQDLNDQELLTLLDEHSDEDEDEGKLQELPGGDDGSNRKF